jgi:ubiquinone/menaquinone biosynthesis C-methylase UbiE
MTDSPASQAPHSAEYFGEERDHWWNGDFLDLLADRLRLGEVSRIADIGCGVGHWSMLVHARLAKDAELIGIDRDAVNVAGAIERAARLAPDKRLSFREGDALDLPLADDSVGAATCQTLLIHLAEPRRALAEMIRITRPGGLILAVEPNNMMSGFGASSLTLDTPIDELLRAAEMSWRYAIGRAKRGLGCEFLGDLLPGMFAEAGLEEVQIWLSDKVLPFVPPYDGPGQQTMLAALDRWQEEGTGPFDRELIRANVLAGGGTEELLAAAWRDKSVDMTRFLAGIRDRSYHASCGGLFYIVAGRVPARR